MIYCNNDKFNIYHRNKFMYHLSESLCHHGNVVYSNLNYFYNYRFDSWNKGYPPTD